MATDAYKVRKLLAQHGLEWPDDEWVEELADSIVEMVVKARTTALNDALNDLRKTSIVTLAGSGGAYEWFKKRNQ